MSDRVATGEPDVGSGLSIQRVSALLGVPAPTIRSWERRYGVPATPRSAGGHRRYQPHDITVLRGMRDEISRGRRAADVAETILERGLAKTPQQPLVTAFLEAAQRLDPSGVRAVLDRSYEAWGLDETIGTVLLPSMRQIGRWWESGECDVAHEHLATEASRAWLNKRLLMGPAPRRSESIILTCGPRDFHTLGMESLGVLLAHRGWACRVLGARTPARAVATAVTGTGAVAAVMVSHLAVARRPAVEAMRVVHSTGVLLFYAGNAFASPQARHGVPGTYLGEDLAQAADTVTAEVLDRRSAHQLS